MGTVIHEKTVRDMTAFFEMNGTGHTQVRSNEEATQQWIEQLSKLYNPSHDMQPLRLAQKMVQMEPRKRLTAPQVMSEILDFREMPNVFCGACCDMSNDTTRSAANEELWPEIDAAMAASMADKEDPFVPDQQDLSDWEEPQNTIENTVERWPPKLDGMRHENAGQAEKERPLQDSVPHTMNHRNWQQPDFEQIDDGLTIKDVYPDQEELIARSLPGHGQAARARLEAKLPSVGEGIEEELEPLMVEVSSNPPGTPGEVPIGHQDSPQPANKDETNVESPTCRWPGCADDSSESSAFDTHEQLSSHYRSVHSVHDFAGSCLLDSSRQACQTSGNVTDDVDMMKFILPNKYEKTSNDNTDTHDEPASKVPQLGTRTREQRPSQSPSELPKSARTPAPLNAPIDTRRLGKKDTDPEETVVRWKSPLGEAAVEPKKTHREQKTLRFDMLPKGKRPEPVVTSSAPVPEQVDMTYHEIMPEPLEEPLLPQTSNNPASSPGLSDGPRLPKSSRVPSYFLASMNRFTRTEVDALTPRARLSSLVPPPLFVYGSLMFPSVLRARAESYIGAEGIYSELHQRRLRTDAGDWARLNFSLQHAAEQMTPAILRGYDVWRPAGLSCAAIERNSHTPQICQDFQRSQSIRFDQCRGDVRGFLIFGLSEEALKCLDHMFSGDGLHSLYGSKISNKDYRSGMERAFKRKSAQVDIGLKGGGSMNVDAVTYMWDGALSRLTSVWKIDKFTKSGRFQKLSGIGDKESIWVAEEEKLADAMGITFVMGGDALCDAIIRDDRDELCRLVEDAGENVNAPCRTYGSAIQAAAAEGRLELVEYLLEKDADVNARGGQYMHPLIAATVRGREDVARALIKAGADVLADGGQYVSPLYQAVDFTDPELAHLLLEKGAWLSKDYQELLDLAAERGNREIIRMLEQYDVRNLHLVRSSKSRRSTDGRGSDSEQSDDREHARTIERRSDDRQVEMKASNVLKKVLWEIAILKGQRGKWTGIKGVRVMRAAMSAGVSEKLLDELRPHLQSSYRLLDFLKDATLNPADDFAPPSPRRVIEDQPRNRDDGQTESARRYSEGTSRRESRRDRRGDRADERYEVSADGSFCISCSGRGGRRGTGRPCPECAGSGKRRVSTGSIPGSSRCRTCKGYGKLFSDRDRCRACQGTVAAEQLVPDIPSYPPPPYTSQVRLER